jgi:hypothetical protein
MKKGVEKEMTENRKRPQERFCHSNYVVLVLISKEGKFKYENSKGGKNRCVVLDVVYR